MADTIRGTIIAAALTQLAEITVANGYQYTMSTPKRGKKAIDPRDFPVSVAFPQTEENTRTHGKHNLEFPLRVESHRVIGMEEDASQIQEKMLGDLITNLTDPSDKWSALVDDIAYTEGGPAEQPEAEDTTTAVFILILIKYKTLIGDPYTQ